MEENYELFMGIYEDYLNCWDPCSYDRDAERVAHYEYYAMEELADEIVGAPFHEVINIIESFMQQMYVYADAANEKSKLLFTVAGDTASAVLEMMKDEKEVIYRGGI